MEEKLPEEYLQLMNDVSDGFLPIDETKKTMKGITNFLNEKVNIPLMSEKKEQKLFTLVVEILFDAMKKGNKLAE
ncbi:MAG: hypothetical protein JKY48_12440 [Flavobacteriales bacterium]|nr:hypothetical protein [Flavobacteriales bacterium]